MTSQTKRASQVALLLLAVSLIGATCNKEMKRSPLEESTNETLAAYMACLRSNTGDNVKAGQNVRDCDPIKEKWIRQDELAVCKTELAEGSRDQCYPVIYGRTKDFTK